jgi:hypothetical protein
MPIFVRDVKTTSYYEKHPKEEARTPAGRIPASWQSARKSPAGKQITIK